MARDIQPLTVDDLSELSRFLIAGFHTQPDADFAALDVLHWKYVEPLKSMTATGNPHDGKGQDRDTDAESSLVPRLVTSRGVRRVRSLAIWASAAPPSRGRQSRPTEGR